MKIKNIRTYIVFLTIMAMVPCSTYSGNGPTDPAGTGSGILGFGFGPGIPYYGSSGFGPAILIHYDHGIWRAGPGTVSLGGQAGTSFFSDKYFHERVNYKYHWVNLGFVFRGAYHYGWKVPGLDTYAGFGAGTYVSIYDDGGYDSGKRSSHVGFLPSAFIGGTFFFSDVVGLNAECGYNFAYFSLGLNFRLSK